MPEQSNRPSSVLVGSVGTKARIHPMRSTDVQEIPAEQRGTQAVSIQPTQVVSSRQAVTAAEAEPTPQYARLLKRAYWLIHLRWLAILGTCVGTFIAHSVLGAIDRGLPLYMVAGVLVMENAVSLLMLHRVKGTDWSRAMTSIGRIIHFQICADLVLLTVLLHYSGSIENPLMVAFVFHMVIASILLPVRESYLQATLAVFLVALLALLEYRGLIPHHGLKGLLTQGFHDNGLYVLGSVSVLAATLYLVVYMTSDISHQLRTQEEAYRRANIQLRQKDCIKDEYVARVTHDIKGHLAAIQSCHDVVVSGIVGPLQGQQRDFLDRAHRRTTQLTKFVKTLLALTEMRLSNHLPMEIFALPQAIEGAVASAQTRAQDKGVELLCHVDPSVQQVYGNSLSIEEMMTNLLLNSVKYTPTGGQVTIQATTQDQQVMVEIRDTGIGIPQDELPHIFDEFYRAKNARQVERDGTGLGLSIVRQIIERHGGQIWVESRENQGTIVRFCLSLIKVGEMISKSTA